MSSLKLVSNWKLHELNNYSTINKVRIIVRQKSSLQSFKIMFRLVMIKNNATLSLFEKVVVIFAIFGNGIDCAIRALPK